MVSTPLPLLHITSMLLRVCATHHMLRQLCSTQCSASCEYAVLLTLRISATFFVSNSASAAALTEGFCPVFMLLACAAGTVHCCQVLLSPRFSSRQRPCYLLLAHWLNVWYVNCCSSKFVCLKCSITARTAAAELQLCSTARQLVELQLLCATVNDRSQPSEGHQLVEKYLTRDVIRLWCARITKEARGTPGTNACSTVV
jgi:hypothetical protein